MNITRRAALTGAAVLAATGAVPVAAMAKVEADAELITLGRQWQKAHDEFLRACNAVETASDVGESDERMRVLEEASNAPADRSWVLRDRIGEIPARSLDGALVKLRVVVAQHRIMDELPHDCFARLTCEALQALEAM